MSEQKTEFDWSPLGEAWWKEAGATCGAKETQIRFACCRHRGMTASGAAKLAGYSGDRESGSIRQAGSRAAKSTAVMNLLAMARAESGGGDDGVVGTAEAKRILSRLARGSDPNVRIKALDSLNKLERDEQAANKQDELDDPTETLRQMICAMPTYGAGFAVGIWFDTHQSIDGFPFLREVAPFLANKLSDEWKHWRGNGPNEFLDSMAAGPLLTWDEIVSALKSTTPTRRVDCFEKEEAANAAA